MKVISLTDHQKQLTALIQSSNEAVAGLERRAEIARQTLAALETTWTSQTLSDATSAAQELAGIETALARIPDADFRARGIAAEYLTANGADVQKLLASEIEKRSAGREAFRQTIAKEISALAEKLALSEDPSQWTELGQKQAALEAKLAAADNTRQHALQMARTLQSEPTLPTFTAAVEIASQITF